MARHVDLVDLLPPCTQCGQAFRDRACGPTHALIAEQPLRHTAGKVIFAAYMKGSARPADDEALDRARREGAAAELSEVERQLLAEFGMNQPVPALSIVRDRAAALREGGE